jgi:ferredoxin, 2Fe-2S
MIEPAAPTIFFELPDGTTLPILASGSVYTVLAAAMRDNVPGIEGQCGGHLACATCHVYIAADWLAIVGPPNNDERALIALTEAPRPESRLCCQIRIETKLDGLVLTPAP